MELSNSSLRSDAFVIKNFNEARPFSSFLPGIAGEYGKPLWVFYANRGQCVASFGIRDRNGAMLEFHPANKAYTLTSLYGFRTFLKITSSVGSLLYEPFQTACVEDVVQKLIIRPEEIEIEETNHKLKLRIRVVYFTLPQENLPALVRRVTIENLGDSNLSIEILDGLPQIVPFGLEEKLLKQLSRTMEAFAEICHSADDLPFFKLKVEPSDKPEVEWISGGFFAFTLQGAQVLPIITDPDLVFGSDTSLRTPIAFMRQGLIAPHTGRTETMTGSAFAMLSAELEPAGISSWDSYFGQAPNWELAYGLRTRIAADAQYASKRQGENAKLIGDLSSQFALIAGPTQLDPYSRQSFLDNTLRGGQPVVVHGPRGPRVFHTFTRKHGDMERDYNFFEVAPTYWSQGNGNFRDVNQNRRSENFIFPEIDASNIETFFNLIQLDGNNPLVIQSEQFCLTIENLESLLADWHAGNTPLWRSLLTQPFSPGVLMEALLDSYGHADMARTWFDRILGQADKVQDATHGEGYWVDHWIYNLDLLDSYVALYPDRLHHLLIKRRDFTYFDNAHIVKPRHEKYVLRQDGTVRQLHAVVKNTGKAALISRRTADPHKVRTAFGQGDIYRTTLLAKILNLMAVKASMLDPFGIGLEMEAEKPGWCDALNGLPGLIGSSTHEAMALQRMSRFVRTTVQTHLLAGTVAVAKEVADLLKSVADILNVADPQNFFASWDLLATRREAYRAETMLGVSGTETLLTGVDIVYFLDAIDKALQAGLSRAVDASGLPVSYFINEVTQFNIIDSADKGHPGNEEPIAVHVQALCFVQKPVSAFLEGSVHALRALHGSAPAKALYKAVRQSLLFDEKLGMYRVNVPLDNESFEIGRSKIFSPGWLENESIFLHMHYKFLLETLRSGLAAEFFEDIKQGLIPFQNPDVYGRSPLENSSFIASSRFPDAKVHGVGFVARLSGATAEWISMVLHMGLGAQPFQMAEGSLCFKPQPVLVDWLFTHESTGSFVKDCFGFKLFGHTWVVYNNPSRKNTFGPDSVTPISFELTYKTGLKQAHQGNCLPEALALDLRRGQLTNLEISLG